MVDNSLYDELMYDRTVDNINIIKALSKKRYIDKLNYYHIPFIEYGTKEEIGNLLNKKEVAILGITEVNISKEIKKLIKEDEIDGLQQ